MGGPSPRKGRPRRRHVLQPGPGAGISTALRNPPPLPKGGVPGPVRVTSTAVDVQVSNGRAHHSLHIAAQVFTSRRRHFPHSENSSSGALEAPVDSKGTKKALHMGKRTCEKKKQTQLEAIGQVVPGNKPPATCASDELKEICCLPSDFRYNELLSNRPFPFYSVEDRRRVLLGYIGHCRHCIGFPG